MRDGSRGDLHVSMRSGVLRVGERCIELDTDGFLRDADDWSPDVARAMAARDGIELGEDHWWLIRFVREHHRDYDNPPLMRVVVAAWRQERGDGSSRDLYRLFPDGPVRQACLYGGLPRPDWCI